MESIFHLNRNWKWKFGHNNRANLKDFKNCEFRPMNLKCGTEDRPVILDFPPDPLHVLLLGSPIDALEKLEVLHFDIMFQFYKKMGLKKSGLSAGKRGDKTSPLKINTKSVLIQQYKSWCHTTFRVYFEGKKHSFHLNHPYPNNYPYPNKLFSKMLELW